MAQQTYGEWMRSNPPIPTLTAVDWYYEQTVIQGKANYSELLEQAKQMEKENIINAYFEGFREGRGIDKIDVSSTIFIEDTNAERYYDATYQPTENHSPKEI